jgi:hypothetical protein
MQAPVFSPTRLNFNDQPRISSIRDFSHRTTITLSMYASATSCRVGSFAGVRRKTGWRRSPAAIRKPTPPTLIASCLILPTLWAYNLVMTLKSAALFALVGMILLTVVLALGFIRDISAFTSGAIAANAMVVSLVHLLASLGVTVFLYVFYSKQS